MSMNAVTIAELEAFARPTEALDVLSEGCGSCGRSVEDCGCLCGTCHEPLSAHETAVTARERMILGAQTFDIRCWNAARAMAAAS